MSDKPNCHQCVHRGDVPGSAHICCQHPLVAPALNHPIGELFKIMGIGPALIPNPLGVTGDAHGIRHGWFAWPFNFDPTWLLTCNGFEARRKGSY